MILTFLITERLELSFTEMERLKRSAFGENQISSGHLKLEFPVRLPNEDRGWEVENVDMSSGERFGLKIKFWELRDLGKSHEMGSNSHE